jgi:hypothetical protein
LLSWWTKEFEPRSTCMQKMKDKKVRVLLM